MNLLQNSSTQLTSSEERLVFALQLLGEKTRFKMFKLLLSHKEMCVSDIASELGITVSGVSQHFRNFEMVGLVEKERMGQKICYSLRTDDALVSELQTIVETGMNTKRRK